jgi:hypothetical protein
MHRLGVFEDIDAENEIDRYYYTDPVASARVHFLAALRRVQPKIVAELRQIARDGRKQSDSTRLADWSKRWHLVDDWCLAYAMATIELYRNHLTESKTLCWNIELGGSGALVSDERPAKSKWKPLTKKPEHFRLLAQFHVNPRFAELGRTLGKKRAATERAIKRLAVAIGLTVRIAPRGNPRIGELGKVHSKKQREQRRAKAFLRNLGR